MVAMILILIGLATYVYYRWRQSVKWADAIPGWDEPLWDKPFFQSAFANRRKRMIMCMKYAKTYPQMYRLMFGPVAKLFITDPELVKQIWTSSKCLKKPAFYRFFGWGAGLATAPVDSWKAHRKILNPAFGLSALQSFIPIFDECSREFATLLKPHLDNGKPFDLLEYAVNTTLDSICATSFGIKINAQKRRLDFNKYLQRVHEIISMRIVNVAFYCDALFACTPFFFEDKYVRKQCITFGDQLINQRKDVLKAVETGTIMKEEKTMLENITHDPKSEKPQIFVDFLLNQEEGKKFNESEIRDHVFTTVSAGNETTALAVSYAIVFMAIHQEVQDRALQELHEVFWDTETPVDYESLNKLTYLEMVLKETLRLCPSVPTMGRELEEDMVLAGFRVPKGTEVLVSAYAVHRREADWGPDNETFDPDRFLPENIASRHQYSWIPFSLGSRNCIGKKYAMLSLKIMLVHLLMSYKFKTPLKWEDIKWQLDVHLHITQPHLITIETRDFFNNNNNNNNEINLKL